MKICTDAEIIDKADDIIRAILSRRKSSDISINSYIEEIRNEAREDFAQ